MSASAQAIEFQEASKSVTKISANARIDYILRFSKQAVLVVDHHLEHCSGVASQFLSSLPADHNAAFVSVSAKLNNIQVRCRIIEQLFNNEFFDPEQSLAVSLINLAKQKKQPVSIVVDNAHLLSLQLIHELCQLADIAKKADYHMTVLMLGTPQAGVIAANNRELFHKKLSILAAQTGQLIPLNAKLFKPTLAIFDWTVKKKLLTALFLTSSILFAALAWVLQSESANFSGLTAANMSPFNGLDTNQDNLEKSTFVKASGNPKEQAIDSKAKQFAATDTLTTNASVIDILRAIESPMSTSLSARDIQQQKPLYASPIDILNALENNESDLKPLYKANIQLTEDDNFQASTSKTTTDFSPQNTEQNTVVDDQKMPFNESQVQYYKEYKQGFVVQIAGFSQLKAYQAFLDEYQKNQFYSYIKLVNERQFLIVTSAVYATRAEAQAAISSLPEALISKQPWVKGISTIIDEINSFQPN